MAARVEINIDGAGFTVVPNSTFTTEATNREVTFGSSARFVITPSDIVRVRVANMETTANLTITACNMDIQAE